MNAEEAERLRPRSSARSTIVSLVGIAFIAVVVYSLLPARTRDDVNFAASRAGIIGRVVPWAERADAMLRRMMDGESENVAGLIQRIVHPTGGSARLRSYGVRHVGNKLSVRISVGWRGGILGTDYATDVVWELDETRHLSAEIVSDSAIVRVAGRNARQLDDYFRLEFYPVLRSNLGD